ncbi:MAG: hypothetical protein RI580_12700 [Halothece sp. Uz-M2-17]|nr:hypothetical protein [Halothece sp. Uz-M2-17]
MILSSLLSSLLTYFAIVAFVLLSIWIGIHLGQYIQRHKKNGKNLSAGSIVSAMLALLGFMLALTLSLVSSRYAARKALVLEEANALGTAILRTDFLEEPLRTQSRQLLIDYVDLRSQVQDIRNISQLQKLLVDSEAIQDELWSLANKASSEEKDTEVFALYIQSLNEVIDLHSERYNQGLQYRLHPTIWFLTYFVTMLAMVAVGYEFGLSNSGSVLGFLLLALMFSAIVLVILDLDKTATKSLIPVSQQPIIDLQEKLKSSSK